MKWNGTIPNEYILPNKHAIISHPRAETNFSVEHKKMRVLYTRTIGENESAKEVGIKAKSMERSSRSAKRRQNGSIRQKLLEAIIIIINRCKSEDNVCCCNQRDAHKSERCTYHPAPERNMRRTASTIDAMQQQGQEDDDKNEK